MLLTSKERQTAATVVRRNVPITNSPVASSTCGIWLWMWVIPKYPTPDAYTTTSMQTVSSGIT